MKLIFHMRSGMAIDITIPEVNDMKHLDVIMRMEGRILIGNDMWLSRDGIDWIQNGDTVHLNKQPDGSMIDPNRILQ